MTDDASSSSAPSPPHRTDPPVDEDKPSAEIAPTHADFLYSYSTVEEHVSYRHSKLESHFVLGLVDAFRERAAHDHLLNIVTNVNQMMSQMEGRLPPLEDRSEIKDFKQTSEVKYTLRKKVRFRY